MPIGSSSASRSLRMWKADHSVFELKRLGDVASRGRAFCAQCGVGGAQAALAHIFREACEFVDRLLNLWRENSRTSAGLPPDEPLLPKPPRDARAVARLT